MPNYIQVSIHNAEQEQKDIIIALLSEEGFDGFEERPSELYSFIEEPAFNEAPLKELSEQFAFSYTTSLIAEQNWNALWEAGFSPVLVDDFVAIRASFHDAVPGMQHEIVITPKMSFGTGHHATTYMMIQLMRELDFRNTAVFDFGTGTGILAILAEQLGAASVLGIDNDDWSIDNAQENLATNHSTHTTIAKADTAATGGSYDVILANINKHIILANMPQLQQQLKENGVLLLSGLLEADEADILPAVAAQGLQHRKTFHRNGWIAMWCSK
ncbi:50S ribosomal protein L11 methyltransferase [Deminuibacter soli]|nr:50S ribosomal protein L11 methyltransferase [Deminuibacter soli]